MKITSEEFRQLMTDPDVPERELRRYLQIDRSQSGPFRPRVLPNPEMVELSEADEAYENALGIGNAFSRWRRQRAFDARLRKGDNSPVLVSEGDSWFQFPFLIDDVIDHLGRDYLIWSSGAAGDTAKNMVFTRPEYFAALEAQAGRVKAFLFSAAGNDVIGDDEDGKPVLAKLLNQSNGNEPAIDLINASAVKAAMNGIKRAYLAVLNRIRSDPRFINLPIIIHGYDYCFPGSPGDERDPIYASPDKWLGSALASKGINDKSIQREIICLLIDQLYSMLDEIALLDSSKAVYVVDARGAMPNKSDWADEIHGTDDGFAKVAERFRRTLEEAIGTHERSRFSRFRGFESTSVRNTQHATVVIDPGHGGEESVGGSNANNTVGAAHGTKEKDLTLEVALLLQQELSDRGHRVLMTRASDRNLGLGARAGKAKSNFADVFVSLHFNGWHTPSVQGTETFHHPRCNQSSRLLARHIQELVCHETGLRDRGVRQLALGVLRPSRHDELTAGCLCEISFLTSPLEENRLRDARYKRRLAIALSDGVERYLEEASEAKLDSFEPFATDYEAEEDEPEYEDGVDVAGKPQGVSADRELRAPLARRFDPNSINIGAQEFKLGGFSDPNRFLEAWRERDLRQGRVEVSGRFERQISTDDSLPAAFLSCGASVSSAVCKIEASGVDFKKRVGSWVGTGFLVGPDLLLTNNHVLNSHQVARNATAVFSFQVDRSGQHLPQKTYRFDPDRLFITSPAIDGLDFTFVHLNGEAHESFGSISLNRGAFVIAPGERANVIHHPNGEPKRVSLRANECIDFDTAFLHYVSDTEPGSSGAPVFDDTWGLIALHHAWDDLPPEIQGPPGRPTTFANEGVKISAIVADLESRLSDTRQSSQARRVLKEVEGSDSITGYFGVVGRSSSAIDMTPKKATEAVYFGGGQDIDLAYLNSQWCTERPRERSSDIAMIIADLNLDLWALTDCSTIAAGAIKRRLLDEFGQEFSVDESSESSLAIFWNPLTLELEQRLALGEPEHPVAMAYRFRAPPQTRQSMEPYSFVYVNALTQLPGIERGFVVALSALVEATLKELDPESRLDSVIGGVKAPAALISSLSAFGFQTVGAQEPDGPAMLVARRPRSLIETVYVPPTMPVVLGDTDWCEHTLDADSLENVSRITGACPQMARLSLLDKVPYTDGGQELQVNPTQLRPPTTRYAHSESAEELIREFLQWLAERRLSTEVTPREEES